MSNYGVGCLERGFKKNRVILAGTVDVKKYLASYRERAGRFIDSFFEVEAEKAALVSPFCAELMRIYQKFAKGGKMARGALVCLGYQSIGGKDHSAILAPSIAVQLIHSFLLIHDDWIDGDLKRYGQPTVYKQIEKIYGERFKKGDRQRWSGGSAFVLGDIGCFLAHKLIADSDFPARAKVRAISFLSQNLVQTGHGEIWDITYDLVTGFSWDEIVKIRKLKTAYYTLVMPLQVGTCLAGGSQAELKAAEEYGFPVGIAFQLRDDYLGLFGDEVKTGKSASSDLREGKKTLIIAKALEILKGKEKKILKQALGNRELTGEQINQVRLIIKASGAVDDCQNLAQELIEKGKKAIPKLTSDKSLQEIYASLADYLVNREK
ncbi:MAG: polyprenyl synthetase family protein [Candidatus Pacebacteria bacterium]|nr:polyprenyl synthetase family protein [Candidatus Paceibacterota bacterium]